MEPAGVLEQHRIRPSLLHDTDGKCYLVNMVNGFKGVLVQQMDPETGALLGERRKVYSGSGIGCTEGPRIYHIGSWYYLVVAEGGTGYSHCVTIARSDNVFGPYETMPDNPLLTSDQNDLTAIQKCGHGSFVETQNGEWYMAHLCSRPNSARGACWARNSSCKKSPGRMAGRGWPAAEKLPKTPCPPQKICQKWSCPQWRNRMTLTFRPLPPAMPRRAPRWAIV